MRRITSKVEIVTLPRSGAAPTTAGYDLVFPIGDGSRDQWMTEIDTIFLRGVPRALRVNGRVYLMQGKDIFFSAPVEEILTDSDRVSWITGEDHGTGPNLIVNLAAGRRHRIDGSAVPTPDGVSWHNRRGIKYVTPGCSAFVKVGPKPPSGAMRARSSPEVALERALAKHLPVQRNARRLKINDGQPRPMVEEDICVPDYRLIVEFDGVWYHGGRGSRQGAMIAESRDRAKTLRLRAAGLHVIRVRDRLRLLDAEWDVAVDEHSTPDDMARAVLSTCRWKRIRRLPRG